MSSWLRQKVEAVKQKAAEAAAAKSKGGLGGEPESVSSPSSTAHLPWCVLTFNFTQGFCCAMCGNKDFGSMEALQKATEEIKMVREEMKSSPAQLNKAQEELKMVRAELNTHRAKNAELEAANKILTEQTENHIRNIVP